MKIQGTEQLEYKNSFTNNISETEENLQFLFAICEDNNTHCENYEQIKNSYLDASVSEAGNSRPKIFDFFQNGENINLKTTNNQTFKFDSHKDNISHAYAVTKVDGNNITFVNPWNSKEEFTISSEEFKKMKFEDIKYIEIPE